MKKYLLLLILFFSPVFAFASSHHFVCADSLSTGGSGQSCTGTDTFTFTGGPASYTDTGGSIYPFADNTDYYLTFTTNLVSCTSGNCQLGPAGDNGHVYAFLPPSRSEYLVHVGSDGPNTGLTFRMDDVATISGICVDDDGTSCTGGGGGGGGGTLPDISTTTATSTLEQTQTNIFFSIILFYLAFWFILTVTKKI